MHHFADDTNLLNFSSSPKKLKTSQSWHESPIWQKKKLSECTEDWIIDL